MCGGVRGIETSRREGRGGEERQGEERGGGCTHVHTNKHGTY